MIHRYRIFEDQDSFRDAGCSVIYTMYRKALRDHGSFHLVLTGGKTCVGIYRTLTEQKWAGLMNWRRVHIWWGDERMVSPDHINSNYNTAWTHLLSHVPVREKRVHRIVGESENAEAAALQYEEDIRRVFRKQRELPVFDLVLLGIGSDGHTASLFPGDDFNRGSHLALGVPTTSVKPKLPRVTLSLDVINNAKSVLFISGTKGKRRVLSSLLKGSLHGIGNKTYPAGLVHPRNECLWHIFNDGDGDIRI